MSNLRSRPISTQRHFQEQPWMTARRGDAIELVGAAVVVLLIFAAVLVVILDGPSDPAGQDLPYLPFAGTGANPPASQAGWP